MLVKAVQVILIRFEWYLFKRAYVHFRNLEHNLENIFTRAMHFDKYILVSLLLFRKIHAHLKVFFHRWESEYKSIHQQLQTNTTTNNVISEYKDIRLFEKDIR